MEKGTKLVEYNAIFLAEAFIEWRSSPYKFKAGILAKHAKTLGISRAHLQKILKDFNNFRPYMEARYGK